MLYVFLFFFKKEEVVFLVWFVLGFSGLGVIFFPRVSMVFVEGFLRFL